MYLNSTVVARPEAGDPLKPDRPASSRPPSGDEQEACELTEMMSPVLRMVDAVTVSVPDLDQGLESVATPPTQRAALQPWARAHDHPRVLLSGWGRPKTRWPAPAASEEGVPDVRRS